MKLKEFFAACVLSAAITLPALGFISYQTSSINNNIVAQTEEIKSIKQQTQQLVAQMDIDRAAANKRFEELAAINDRRTAEFEQRHANQTLLVRYP